MKNSLMVNFTEKGIRPSRIIVHTQLVPGEYYYCRSKLSGEVRIELCGVLGGKDNHAVYIGSNHLWCYEGNLSAFTRYDIYGPVILPTFNEQGMLV